ncbi:MAG: SDR family oxidoreductase [Acidimicrobiia bacterium]
MDVVSSLEGHTAVVVGASSGMGCGVVRYLATEGANVLAAARRADRLDELVGSLAGVAGSVTAIPADVTLRRDVDSLFERAEAADPPFDIVVNTAGAVAYSDFVEQSEDDWEMLIATNLTGSLRVSQAALRHLLPRDTGRIVHVTSVAATTPVPGMAVYCATKAAVSQFLSALRGEIGTTGVRVTEFEVGATEGTEMGRGIHDRSETMMERMVRFAGAEHRMTVEDVAATVVAVLEAPRGSRVDHIRLREPSDIPT